MTDELKPFPWWYMRPIIAPLPKGFMDEDTSRKESYEWMDRAASELTDKTLLIAELEALVQQAFIEGFTKTPRNCVSAAPIAWSRSAARAALKGQGDEA